MTTQGIRVHATFVLKDTKDKDELMKLAKPLMEATRKEDGFHEWLGQLHQVVLVLGVLENKGGVHSDSLSCHAALRMGFSS